MEGLGGRQRANAVGRLYVRDEKRRGARNRLPKTGRRFDADGGKDSANLRRIRVMNL